MDQFGEKVPLPSNSSKTIRFVRQEKFSSAVPAQLTEGVAPDAIGFAVNQFEAVVEQYGVVTRISDLAELTAKHNIVERTMHMLGLQSGEIYDQLIFTVLDAATSVYRPNNKAADVDLVAGDLPSYNDLIELDALLNTAGARQFGDGLFAFVTSSQPYAAITKDPDFKASHQLVAPEAIWRAQVGNLGGFSIVRSNAPGISTATLQAGSGDSSKVYSSFALGRMAYQISDLQNLRVYVVAPGGQSDPLQQSRKIGWKFAFKSVITNQTWIRRVRTSGLDSITNP